MDNNNEDFERRVLEAVPEEKKRMREVKICVDTREPEYASLIERALKILYPSRAGRLLVREELDVGDIAFRDKDGNLFGFVIESKTMSDLASSIFDGRYHQQKGRMFAMGIPRQNIMYILVGDMAAKGAITTIGRLGAVTKTICGDGCQALNAMTHADVALFVLSQHVYLEQCGDDAVRERQFDFSKCLASSGNKREYENDPGRKLESLLQKVPSISADKARGIRRVYPTWTALQQAYRDCEGDPDDLLADIEWRGGRIGPAASKAVCIYFEMRTVWSQDTVSDRNARRDEKKKKRGGGDASDRKRAKTEPTPVTDDDDDDDNDDSKASPVQSRPSASKEETQKKRNSKANRFYDDEEDEDIANRWAGGDFAKVFKNIYTKRFHDNKN